MALDIAICESFSLNQGVEDCQVNLSALNRGISIPKGDTTDATFWATPEASIRAKLLDDSPALRWVPTPRFNEMVEEMAETTFVTGADGSRHVTKEGSSNFKFTLKDNSLCAQQNLLAFDNCKKDWLLVQNNGTILGQKANASTSPYGVKQGGFKPQLAYVPKPTNALTTDTANGGLHLNFLDPKTDFKNMRAAVCKDFDLQALLDECSIKNVKVQLSAALTTTGVVKFKLYSCGGTNLGQVYATELNSAALFTMVNGTTATALAKTLAVNAISGEFTMTATTPPAVNTPMIIGLAAVNTLAAAGVEYYETPASRLDGTINNDSFKLTVLNIA